MLPQRGKRTTTFLRVYSWVFCAALWLVVLACVLGAVSNSGEDRQPFLFFTVIVGSMALGSTLLPGSDAAIRRTSAPGEHKHKATAVGARGLRADARRVRALAQ